MADLKGYHAHVYFDAATRASAERLRDAIVSRFAVRAGIFADEARGPHPIPQFNIIFEEPEFQKIVPWLMLNHEDFSVLIHPLSESNVDDHSKYALWLGTPVPMRLERLSKQLPQDLLPVSQQTKS
jgi:aromatic ring-cleaving dioxygenase